MKLAEALMERADLQKRLDQLRDRLRSNARVQEGEQPAEDPQALLRELESGIQRMEWLATRINLTNTRTQAAGESLTALLARRDAWRQETAMLREFLDAASALAERASRSEIKVQSTVHVAALQKTLDQKCKALRELDACIQAANWTTELDEKA